MQATDAAASPAAQAVTRRTSTAGTTTEPGTRASGVLLMRLGSVRAIVSQPVQVVAASEPGRGGEPDAGAGRDVGRCRRWDACQSSSPRMSSGLSAPPARAPSSTTLANSARFLSCSATTLSSIVSAQTSR